MDSIIVLILILLWLCCNIIAVIILYCYCHLRCSSRFKLFWDHDRDATYAVSRVLKVSYLSSDQAAGYCCGLVWTAVSLSATTGPGVATKKACTWSWSSDKLIQHSAIQYNLIAKCQYNCTRNVLWCQIPSSHIHTNHKTWDYNNSKYQPSG